MDLPPPHDWKAGNAAAIGFGHLGPEPGLESARAAVEWGKSPAEKRAAQRHTAEVSGRLRLPASEHDCHILDLSVLGMRLASPCAVITVGEQVAIETQDFPLFVGSVTWNRDGELGVQFANPIAEAIVEGVINRTRRARTPRGARFAIELPGLVYFDVQRFDVIVRNISAGGLMMTARRPVKRGQRNPIRRGQALMIELPEMWPIGGHVRWTCGAQAGVMFSKLLKPATAEDIVRLSNISPVFLDEARLAHDRLTLR